MSKRASGTNKSTRNNGVAAKSLAAASRFDLPPTIRKRLAYALIGGTAIASWFLTPPPVAAGFTTLAVVRVAIAIREERKERSSAGA